MRALSITCGFSLGILVEAVEAKAKGIDQIGLAVLGYPGDGQLLGAGDLLDLHGPE
ncbi:hypothetical protein D3C77_799260 [compost metagenome]